MSGKLRFAIEEALNRNNAENGSDTPDFILAEYVRDTPDFILAEYVRAVDRDVALREQWYGCGAKGCLEYPHEGFVHE